MVVCWEEIYIYPVLGFTRLGGIGVIEDETVCFILPVGAEKSHRDHFWIDLVQGC